MAPINDFFLGLRSYGNSVAFVVKHKFYAYFLFPILFFAVIFHFGLEMASIANQLSKQPVEGSFLHKVWVLAKLGFFHALGFLALSLTRYIMMIVLSPILSIVSERVEKIITGNVYAFNFPQLLKDIKRGAYVSVRNLIWENIYAYSVWLIVAVIGMILGFEWELTKLIANTIGIVIGFYYYGFGFMDYINERIRWNLKESVLFVRKHKGLALALGSIFMVFYHYLIIGVADHRWLFWPGSIIASCIPIFSIVAATLAMHELIDLNKSKYVKEKLGTAAVK